MNNQQIQATNFILYTAPSGDVQLNVALRGETVWLTQKAMADLFAVGVPAINKHLKNIFETNELVEDSVISILETTAADGKNYKTQYYNIDAIISVGYRVNSREATQFRIWATRTLKEYIIKGFVLDDERLKQGSQVFGKDYFDELLERIREIRASERRFYQKITDIYALSVDYDKNAPLTKEFFATVQNKLHWAITGKTSAEIIYQSVDASKPKMGLMTFKNAPNGKVLKSDVAVAKNYLSEQHIRELERIVSAYLDLAENRAERQIVMKMADWITFLNGFLELSNYPILQDAGKVSAEMAKLKAEKVYETFRVEQDRHFVSDFDKTVKTLKKPSKSKKQEPKE
ncbi:virulence RhuM family protein [Methylobacillus caricis]|uniref:virulence RhuM family protein n=1 Tax=Methylobacillus caricis TaxID=1971611 RepID=UPI001CFF8DC2|nr:virulence RhuM family protein [Methylobacillus caricis]MCB5187822.1 virulence RhuM family protein [Methylobacillus caricis]